MKSDMSDIFVVPHRSTKRRRVSQQWMFLPLISILAFGIILSLLPSIVQEQQTYIFGVPVVHSFSSPNPIRRVVLQHPVLGSDSSLVPFTISTYCRRTQNVETIQCWNLPTISSSFRKISSTRLYDTEGGDIEKHANPTTTALAAASITTEAETDHQTADDVVSPWNNDPAANEESTISLVENINGIKFNTKNGVAGNHDISSNGIAAVGLHEDIPMPTANGGFTHTKASKAKIGAANRGKTPWNKGRQRSPEVKARIAAGVRARNRERFLQKIKDMGLTEEQYEAKKKEERRKKDAERRARRTAKGGYTPTDETKKKISRVLKEKYANGEIKPRKVDPSKVRRGFTHSEETRAKISESLRKRWANDPAYRANMEEKTKNQRLGPDYRKKISESLRKKWQDPEFRAEMMEKIANRKYDGGSHGEAHRAKISKAMKAKWQDAAYREKTLSSIAKRQEELRLTRPVKPRVVKKKQSKSKPKAVSKRSSASKNVNKVVPRAATTKRTKIPTSNNYVFVGDEVRRMQPAQQRTTTGMPKKKKKKKSSSPSSVATKKKVKKKVKKSKTVAFDDDGNRIVNKKKSATKKKVEKEPDGSVNRLREERRDLFDLLYGDEDDILGDDDGDDDLSSSANTGVRSSSRSFVLGDENLDTFDPYGLDDY